MMVLIPLKSHKLIGQVDQQFDLELTRTNASAKFSCRNTTLNNMSLRLVEIFIL